MFIYLARHASLIYVFIGMDLYPLYSQSLVALVVLSLPPLFVPAEVLDFSSPTS